MSPSFICSNRSSFLRGFLPGVLIGVFTSVLLFSIWQTHPIATVQIDLVVFPMRRDQPLPTAAASNWSSEVTEVTRESPSPSPEATPSSPPAPDAVASDVEGECERWRDFIGSRSPEKPVFLLVLVHSTADEVSLREAVRETWLASAKANPAGNRVLARFVIGTKDRPTSALARLACENKHHGDLVLLPNVSDGLPDLPSSKKLLASFEWAEAHVEYSFLLKCNSASFVLLEHIVSSLQHRHANESLMWGFFAGSEHVEREGSMGEPNWYLCTTFLPYPQGGGYVITRDLLQILVQASQDLEHFNRGDIALGVWLAPFNNINRIHDVQFNSGYYSRGCNNAYVVSHRETGASMREKSEQLAKAGMLCKEEVQSRLSYIYNWNGPVSKCCVRQRGVP